MSVNCDWCGQKIYGDGKDRWGHEVSFPTFDSLNLGGSLAKKGRPSGITLSVHLHPPCREAAVSEFYRVVGDHEPDALDLERVSDWEGDEDEDETPEETERQKERRQAIAQERVWKGMDAHVREHLIFDVLGDDPLTVREIFERFEPRVREMGGKVWEGSVRALVTKLYKAGALDRKPETFRKTRTRYRYFRNRTLEGPIKDLDEALAEEN